MLPCGANELAGMGKNAATGTASIGLIRATVTLVGGSSDCCCSWIECGSGCSRNAQNSTSSAFGVLVADRTGCLDCFRKSHFFQPLPIHVRICLTNVSLLCYNSITGQGQMFWVTVRAVPGILKWGCVVSMVSINSGIRVYGVEND